MKILGLVGFALFWIAGAICAPAEDFTNAVQGYLRERVETAKVNAGVVVGIVDEHGARIVSYGKMDNGTDHEVDGDTVFEVGSLTNVFTALLKPVTIERGESPSATNYESLLAAHISRPLGMESTGVALTPEMKSRFAVGHNRLGYIVSKSPTFPGTPHSTANDLLKFVAASMNKTNATEGAWMQSAGPDGANIVWRGGVSEGYGVFVGFDKSRRRGVVVLANFIVDGSAIGRALLESDWPGSRPGKPVSAGVAGANSVEHGHTESGLPALAIQQLFFKLPKAAFYIPAGICFALVLVLCWRARAKRMCWGILVGAILIGGLMVALLGIHSRTRTVFLLRTANERIATLRKARAQIKIVNSAGFPVSGATVRVEMRRHAFLFGCDAFRFFYVPDDLNQLYADRFSALFNYATIPFYWSLYEPEKGDTSAYDKKHRCVAKWFGAHGIEAKGHPLVWHDLYPSWAPSDPDAVRDAVHHRIDTIIPASKSEIHRWDIVNEATVAANFKTGIGNWARRDGAANVVENAMRWAHELDPTASLVYNDYNLGSDHRRLLAKLIKDDAPFQVIGLQMHMHHMEWPLEAIWDTCDRYSGYGKAIHVSEITVLSGQHGWELPPPWSTTPDGEARQADYVEKMYTLLFSHPGVQAITWWDLEDGAWMGAPGGLVRADMTPKPAYNRLLKLIHETWWTRESLVSDAKGDCAFTGFLGDYELIVQKGTRIAKMPFALGKGTNSWTITLADENPSEPLRPPSNPVIKLDTNLLDVCNFEPSKRHVAIKLSTNSLDAVAGLYEHAPCAVFPSGAKITIWRDGDRLFGRAQGKNLIPDVVGIFPETETNFFFEVSASQLTFIKDKTGRVTSVIHRYSGYPDSEGIRVETTR